MAETSLGGISVMIAGAGSDDADLSVFENKSGLAEDLKFLASMPELCDVTFLVGDTREPVCAVKAVLAARSRLVSLSNNQSISIFYLNCTTRVFQKMLYATPSPQRKKETGRENKLRLFLKRSSEPLMTMQNTAEKVITCVWYKLFNSVL